MELITYLTVSERTQETAYYFQQTHGEIFDFLKWTAIGTMAGLWAFGAAKSRERGIRVLYYLMLLPLFAVIIMELVTSAAAMYHYVIQEYNRAHYIADTEGVFYTCPISELLNSIVLLLICAYKYLEILKGTSKNPF